MRGPGACAEPGARQHDPDDALGPKPIAQLGERLQGRERSGGCNGGRKHHETPIDLRQRDCYCAEHGNSCTSTPLDK